MGSSRRRWDAHRTAVRAAAACAGFAGPVCGSASAAVATYAAPLPFAAEPPG